MKKLLCLLLALATISAASIPSLATPDSDYVKVGLRYDDTAMFAANLENAEGQGYEFGWYDEYREFQPIGSTDETTITMIAAGDIYMNDARQYSPDMPSGTHRFLGGWHVQLDGYRNYDSALEDAEQYSGWPAYIDDEYVVRFGSFPTDWEAEEAACKVDGGYAVPSTGTGIVIAETKTDNILFEFDNEGRDSLGVQPISWGREDTVTWFKGYRYNGGFEYPRANGGNLSVINVVDLEDYVKGVIPYEMSGNWPLAALEAQAVCARTFVKGCVKHNSNGFDVCNGAHCQVYNGLNTASENSNLAVDNTAGECLYYQGKIVSDAVYHSSDGGATEDVRNVWGGKEPYLKGKEDPFEAQIKIPGYEWSVTYTDSELSWILEQKGEDIGRVKNVYVSNRTAMGNVEEVTFEGTRGTLKVSGDRCRTIFYSSTYQKSVRSLRFEINGDGGGTPGLYINDMGHPLETLEGISVVSGKGTNTTLPGNVASVMTANGIQEISGSKSAARPARNDGTFTITGTGNGHNVGMSQYGARAMAEQGYTYREILEFYYTDITIG